MADLWLSVDDGAALPVEQAADRLAEDRPAA
jgi:hypothetical protein